MESSSTALATAAFFWRLDAEFLHLFLRDRRSDDLQFGRLKEFFPILLHLLFHVLDAELL